VTDERRLRSLWSDLRQSKWGTPGKSIPSQLLTTHAQTANGGGGVAQVSEVRLRPLT